MHQSDRDGGYDTRFEEYDLQAERAEAAKIIADRTLEQLEVGPKSSYVTHHDVRQAALLSARLALESASPDHVSKVINGAAETRNGYKSENFLNQYRALVSEQIANMTGSPQEQLPPNPPANNELDLMAGIAFTPNLGYQRSVQ